MITFKTSEK